VKLPDRHVLVSGRARLCWSLIWQHAIRTSMYYVRTRAFFFLWQTHILLFACSIMLCCVCFLSNWSRDFGILSTSSLIPMYFFWLSLFSWALVIFRILESLIDYDLRDCAWISFCLYAGWILLICIFWIAISTIVFFLCIQLIAIIIPYSFWN
jgi:hypothetical protein